jgi:hypothetical protein
MTYSRARSATPGTTIITTRKFRRVPRCAQHEEYGKALYPRMRLGMRQVLFTYLQAPRRGGGGTDVRRPPGARFRVGASSTTRGGKLGKRKVLGIVLGAFVLLLIIGVAGHHGTSTPTGDASPSATGVTAHTATSAPGFAIVKAVKRHPIKKRTAAVASRAAHRPRRRHHRRMRHRLHQSKPHKRRAHTFGGRDWLLSDQCYEPGEYCRDSDHGSSGVAGDGEAITCEDNDGWRWEPS